DELTLDPPQLVCVSRELGARRAALRQELAHELEPAEPEEEEAVEVRVHAASSRAGSSAAATASCRGRSAVNARTTPPPAITVSTAKEPGNPGVSADADARCPRAAVAIVLTIARPMAPPPCRLVLTSPDAIPAAVAGTPCRAAIVTATNETPIPIPISRNDGRRAVT